MRESSGQTKIDALSRPKGKDYQYLIRMFQYMVPYRRALVFAAIALIITSGATLSIGFGMKFLIDSGLGSDNNYLLDQGLFLLLVIVFFISTGTYFRFFYISWVGERVVADIRNDVYRKILTLSPGFFETTPTGEILTRLTADTSVLQTVIGSSLSIALRNILSLIGGLVLLAYTSAKLMALVALIVPAVIVPIIFYGHKVRRFSRASQARVADVGSYAEESINAIRTVQAYSHEDVDQVRYTDEVENAFLTSVKRISARAMLGSVVICLVFGAISLVLWAGGKDVISGQLSPGELTSFVFYAIIVAAAAGALTEVIGDLQRAAGATERLIELLETEPDIRPPANPLPMLDPPVGEVVFRDVSFRYPSRSDTAALSNLSIKVKSGETVALVGPSGAGKTTVFQLLLRFYDPNSGSVIIDGTDIRNVDPKKVRRRIGLVSQDPIIFSTNAFENIRYGRPEAKDEEVYAAAEAAIATEFIAKLPEGFDTFLGQKGTRLSGGQKQRIAIARAILRDPAFLLLDEATSALDAENENLVQQALETVMDGRTTMVIAHRLATVVRANRIILLDKGKNIANGDHQSLLRSSTLYAKLSQLQFNSKFDFSQ